MWCNIHGENHKGKIRKFACKISNLPRFKNKTMKQITIEVIKLVEDKKRNQFKNVYSQKEPTHTFYRR
jgi:hypothetical protein